jgi:ectoine hydroxylase-related dioxygenase (phytanoyl-CoA dioxygenase family)
MSLPAVGDESVERFQADGYVVIPDLLSDDELDRYGRLVGDAVRSRKSEDHRRLEDKTRYEQSFIQCQNLWEDFDTVRPLTFHPRIAQAAANLLRADAVRLWHDQALFKEPGGRETDLHQDQPYWPIAEPDTITAWIPFEGSTAASGCMGYVPGSHRQGIRSFVDIFRGDDDAVRAQAEQLRTADVAYVEVPRGGVAFHHGFTAHLARPNTTGAVRAVHTIIYFRDGCTRASEQGHPSVDRAEIGVGEPIASAVTPVVWPRPAGDLPEPPPPNPDNPAWLRRLGLVPRR